MHLRLALALVSLYLAERSKGASIFNDTSKLLDSYDFVIAGGGVGGLVLASRLSEDANRTVLVIEAGGDGSAFADRINIPSNTYFETLQHTAFDWAYPTTQQTALSDRVVTWPRGRGLGGSSSINGMYLTRPSSQEINVWHGLLGDMEGAESWTWDSFYAAMKKTENFGAPLSDVQALGGIIFDAASHGTSGPLHHSYPGAMLSIVGNWTETCKAAGVGASTDAYGGNPNGAFIATSAIDPNNWLRSYSKSAYLDATGTRSNLHVLTDYLVTRVVFSSNSSSTGNITASAIEFAASATAKRQTVGVKVEAILAGGAVGSPAMLMHSGIGPKDTLTSAGVKVALDLPGVGQHLQDHVSTTIIWTTDAENAVDLHNQALASDNYIQMASYINAAEAYVNTSVLLGADGAAALQSQARSSLAASSIPSKDATVLAGFNAIYNATADFLTTNNAVIELLFTAFGNAKPGSLGIQAALQHPFSHGRVYIQSDDPFTYPSIDPGYMSNDVDVTILREGLKLARKIGQTPPLSNHALEELSPGSSVSTDAEWDAWLKSSISTEYHPLGSCSMLPRSLGGVVDARLKVYGTSNLRVIDASILPGELNAHLMTSTYALAEIASDFIRQQYNVPTASSSSSTSTSTTSSSSRASTSSASETKESSALPSQLLGSSGWWTGVLLVGTMAHLLL